MASPEYDETDSATAGGASCEMDELEELRRVQIANEGMNLLLSSRLKEAEELFQKSRLVNVQGNVWCDTNHAVPMLRVLCR